MNKKWLVLLGLGGLGALFFTAGASASEREDDDDAPPAPEPASLAKKDEAAIQNVAKAIASNDADKLMEAVAKAIATGNPDVIERVADALDKLNNPNAAALRRYASELREAMPEGAVRATEEVVKAVTKPTITKPPVVAKPPVKVTPPKKPTKPAKQKPPAVQKPPAAPPAGAPPNEDFAKGATRATAFALYIASKKKGTEDQEVVRNYQAAEGLTIDGKYGPKTALEVGSFGIVPPPPFYWPTNWVQAKKDYKAGLEDLAATYPEKRTEFLLAAGKVGV